MNIYKVDVNIIERITIMQYFFVFNMMRTLFTKMLYHRQKRFDLLTYFFFDFQLIILLKLK